MKISKFNGRNNISNQQEPGSLRADISFFRNCFAFSDSRLSIDDARKNSTLATLRQAINAKKILFVSDKRKIWYGQLHYADKTILYFHTFVCVFFLLALKLMEMQQAEWTQMLTASMTLSGILGTLSMLAAGKSCLASLAELSESCFFNVRQMTAFDMVFADLISLVFLAAAILFAGFWWKIGLIRIGLYILVPFSFTQCVCLGILLTERGRRSLWLITATGILLSVFCVVLASYPRLYTGSALFFWAVALAAFGLIQGIQIKLLFAKLRKGEMLCTNWN